ncbi:MAG: MBL fold metallo-hydrolase [Promicromonosporaceae bacterium]|nr:MBL fold metallo-hydrolase [Promicromonosporaceae bacterium]
MPSQDSSKVDSTSPAQGITSLTDPGMLGKRNHWLCGTPDLFSSDAAEGSKATAVTARDNEAFYQRLNFADNTEQDFAQRGLLLKPDSLEITNDDGKVIWTQNAYEFLSGAAPDTANPSLWRNAQLNHNYGLFEVTDGIYQVRGYDISNITFIRGDTGWVVFDPLSNIETARAAYDLISEHFGYRPITGVVISHSHADHFAGIRGIISPEDAAERQVPIIAPAGFTEHAVSEFVYAGPAMLRRAEYMYGETIAAGPDKRISVGLGLAMPSGTSSYIAPTDIIEKTGETRTIDGVSLEFQMTPGTEAPSEMNTWLPDKKALWLAENCTATLHNLYTLRGAQVRDGNAWAKYLLETLTRYGNDAQVAFQSHNWPHWGNEFIKEYLLNSALAYKFINDQTLFYLNQGDTATEIAAKMEFPAGLDQFWYLRPYYGTVKHNSRAVYQRFLGWYDANPANLNPLPPSEHAKKLVEYLGDTAAVIRRAQADYDAGEYQWVAELMNALVFADPSNQPARDLGASALEQLGFQSEAGTWRSAYLTGADELRHGTPQSGQQFAQSGDLLAALTPEMVFDFLGIHLDSSKASALDTTINIKAIGGQDYLLIVKYGILVVQANAQSPTAEATISLPLPMIPLLLSEKLFHSPQVTITGNPDAYAKIQKALVNFDPNFAIIEP